MAFERQETAPIGAYVVLVKPTAPDSFGMLGGPTNVFATKPEAVAAAAAYVAGPPSNGYQAVVLEPDQLAVFQNAE